MQTPASLANRLAKVAFVTVLAVGICRAVGGIVAHAAKLAVFATRLQVENAASSITNNISIWQGYG